MQKRTDDLQDELVQMRQQREEYLRLRDQLMRLRRDLSATTTRCSALTRENSALRERVMVGGPPSVADPISDQVRLFLREI